jgi:phage terminase large subunit-like protein
MSFAGLLRRLAGKKRPRPGISRQDAMRVSPVRNPNLEWELDEDGVVTATLKRPQDLRNRLIGGFLMLPESRKLKLDEVGTFVWDLCDGQHTVADLVSAMTEKYKLSRREVEVSLTEFLRMLAKRGMIVVAVPQDVVDTLDPETAKALGITGIDNR